MVSSMHPYLICTTVSVVTSYALVAVLCNTGSFTSNLDCSLSLPDAKL